MTRQDIQDRWSVRIDEIRRHWPELTETRLRRVGGDMPELRRYLAETYELTVGEATEAVEDWLILLHLRARST